ncbi:MAG: tetratricopeptide repeat protein [Treponemataceae bacterium]|nr:tetratricopeptide repeat protein [Treponemataceae bacterium]
MKKIIALLVLCFVCISFGITQVTTDDYLNKGLQAYKDGNWESAILLLKNAVSIPESSTPEVLYVLVMSEMFNGNYQDVLKDGKTFCNLYPTSEYKVYVDYQMGRALHYLGRYVDSISVLQKFCADNQDNELFSSALFWMAESFYASYYFDEAKGLYERVVTDFPDSPKYVESLYRLDLIVQREKEEKLLYLLKVTGEEYISSKENYDRQIKQYNTEESIGLRNQLRIANDNLKKSQSELDIIRTEKSNLEAKYADLEKNYNELQEQINQLNLEKESERLKSLQDIEALKRKAQLIQEALDLEVQNNQNDSGSELNETN